MAAVGDPLATTGGGGIPVETDTGVVAPLNTAEGGWPTCTYQTTSDAARSIMLSVNIDWMCNYRLMSVELLSFK